MNGWWCSAATFILMVFGRDCIAYNSLFVALVRYIYIVHQKKSNQWDFEKVGFYFRITSIAVPFGVETFGLFVNNFPHHQIMREKDIFKSCVSSLQGFNNTVGIPTPEPYFRSLAIQVVPEWILYGVYIVYYCITIVVFLNLIEGILYYQIFQTIKR